MPRKRTAPKPLDTIWEASDDLWARVLPILQDDWKPSPKGGQPPKDWRPMFNGIIHRLRSGCQWNHLPKQFGSDRTIHRWFQRWCQNGTLRKVWAALVAECDELGAVQWDWQSADAALGKARFGGGKRWARTPPTAARTAARRACSPTRRAGRWGRWWRRPTSTTTCCWRRPSRPSSWSGRSRAPRGRSTCAWMGGITTSPVGRWRRGTTTRPTSVRAGRRRGRTARRRRTSRGGGWWSGRWPG